jgi:hypothetical protein
MYATAGMLSTEDMYDTLWTAGEELREQCMEVCNTVVYGSMVSKRYTRTRFLLFSLFLDTKYKTDYNERLARAQSRALAIYPKRMKSYRFVPHTGGVASKEIRVTAGAIYSDHVEYGRGPNKKRGPRPFMRAGLDAGRRDVINVIESGIHHLSSQLNAGKSNFRYRDPVTGRFAKRPK